MPSITLENVGLTFRVRRQRRSPLKDLVLRRLSRGTTDDPRMEVHALSGINAHFGDGERIGIIGHNGAGKSTLLKVLAGVYRPSSGQCRSVGRISSLFDLVLGFDLFATGRENIRLRGYLLGETPDSLDRKEESIIDFADLGAFIDTPVRYYSAGMKARLGFSITTAIEPEIILMDECFSAGDRSFRDKAAQRLEEMVDRARLIILVSHDTDTIARMSSRVLWLESGKVRRDGPSEEVIAEYDEAMGSGRSHRVGGATNRDAA